MVLTLRGCWWLEPKKRRGRDPRPLRDNQVLQLTNLTPSGVTLSLHEIIVQEDLLHCVLTLRGSSDLRAVAPALAIAGVCRDWRAAMISPDLWRSLCSARWGSTLELKLESTLGMPSGIDWRSFYRRRAEAAIKPSHLQLAPGELTLLFEARTARRRLPSSSLLNHPLPPPSFFS